MKKASLHTLGCRLNQSETTLIAERLKEAGFTLVPFGRTADLGIINTCTVTREADAKSRQAVRQFIRKNPEAYTAVIGCYSQLGYEQLAGIDGVDLIVGNQEKLNVLDYVAQGKNGAPLIIRDRILRDDFTIVTAGSAALSTRTNLKIQDGCNFMCSFCVIPFARGRSRSRVLEDLTEEARKLAAAGVKEIVLTGVNIGTYTHEGRTVADVVDALDAIDGVGRVRISSIEPTTIPEEILERMADPRHSLVPYLHIPAQSGSNRVLSLMKRRYTREEFVSYIERANECVPGICIGTDLLVGQPGESDADFDETLSLVMDTPIHYAHVFKYSEREGTAASRYQEKVDPRVMSARSAALRRAAAAKRHAYYQEYCGMRLDVLFEEEEAGRWYGYTPNYIRVAVASKKDLTNTIASVRLDAVCGDIVQGTISENV